MLADDGATRISEHDLVAGPLVCCADGPLAQDDGLGAEPSDFDRPTL